MAKCPLCSKRAAKRACPSKKTKICALCCGTKREIEIDCPSDCVYLQTGRDYEHRHPPAEPTGPRREFSEQFRQRYAVVIMTLVHTILDERRDNPALVDMDVRASLEALRTTANTLASGIHYETLPEAGPNAMGLYRRTQGVLRRLLETSDELRAGEVAGVLDFILASVDWHSSSRPKSRRYLDWLASVAPAPATTEPPNLIVP